MTLEPGTSLGPFEILAPLGVGGMGEVYRARDTRLGREVAVKVLPEHLSLNPEARARFEREAKTISGLNHPNICVLFDVGREGDVDYLVMELVEGETLSARLARGPLPLVELLRIGREIADALDRAHRAGVVHRDLKPGNIMLTKSGAKLLDFGLARATGMAGPIGGSGLTMTALPPSPAEPQPLTAEGTIVGTFHYMAPEQLEGGEADGRSDLWAFGCVLYEMATGQRAFGGKSQASLISSIMSAQPMPLMELAPLVPPALEHLVRACLAKDPADRIQSAHDVKLQLAWITEAGSQSTAAAPAAPRRRSRASLAWGVASVAVVAGAVAMALALTRPQPVSLPVRAALLPPPGVLFSSSTDKALPLAISPDGAVVAFCARRGEGPDMLWVRPLDSEDAQPLAGTEGAEGPFFSPDGRSLGFFAHGQLKRVDVTGGPVIELAPIISARGGTWGRDDVILFTKGSYGPVSRVSADGGTVTEVTELDSAQGEATHRYPHFLPDGRHFLYLSRRTGAGSGREPTIYARSLDSAAPTPVLEVASNVLFASGHLLYVRGGILMAQRFDPGKLAVTGPAIPLVDDARMDERFSRGVFAASRNGVLICMTGKDQTRTQLRWLDRSGRKLGDVGEPADYTYGGTPQLSPDGSSAVLPIANRDRGTSDVWIVELETGRRRKLTVDTKDHPGAAWLADGKSVVVTRMDQEQGGLERIRVDGTHVEELLPGPVSNFLFPLSSNRNGFALYASEGRGIESGSDIWVTNLLGDRTPVAFAAGPVREAQAQFSTDGSFVAYATEETGRMEVVVAAFPQPGGRWQVSQDGGSEPRWRRNGRELFYVDRENYIVCVDVTLAAGGLEMGASRRLFQFHGAGGDWRYDVSVEGDRFLVTTPLEEDLASPVTLITDWTHGLSGR
jgi:eukaryotic-like serine/threonine-protein kinase